MAMYSASIPTYTTSAVADTTNLTTQTFVAIQGANATQRNKISEVYVGGQAAASAPQYLLLARDSTVFSGATSNGVRQALLDGSGTAAGAVALTQNVGSTTLPQRSSSLSLLNLTFNAFGGIVRWVAAPGSEISIVGNTASLGEVSLSGFTGTTPGLVGAHIIYEVV
ncbi:MAG: hypothetical protein ACRCZI_04075 [Cetobacterium sp.]